MCKILHAVWYLGGVLSKWWLREKGEEKELIVRLGLEGTSDTSSDSGSAQAKAIDMLTIVEYSDSECEDDPCVAKQGELSIALPTTEQGWIKAFSIGFRRRTQGLQQHWTLEMENKVKRC